MFKTWEEYTPLEQAAVLYSDYYKDVNGFRPRNDISGWTLEDFDREMERLSAEMEVQMAYDKERKNEAVNKFELLVRNTIDMGAGDRETALKWIRDAEDDDYMKYDDDHFEYRYGLPYGYLKGVK